MQPTAKFLTNFGLQNIEECLEEENIDANLPSTSKQKWTKTSIKLLIQLRMELDAMFKENNKKTDDKWKVVALKLGEKGHSYTATQCNDKWRYLKSKYTQKKTT